MVGAQVPIVRAVIGLGHERVDGVPDDVGAGIAKNLLGSIIERLDRPASVDGDDGVDDGVEYGVGTCFSLCLRRR